MATETDTPDSFEGVDWDRIDRDRSRITLSRRSAGQLLSLLAILVGFGYDYFAKGQGQPTFETWYSVYYDTAGGGETVFEFLNVHVVNVTWDLISTDWLFLATLVILLFNVAVPAYQNRGMTMYYWKRFKRNRAAVVALGFLVVMFTVGTFGPVFIPPPEPFSNPTYQPPVGITAAPQGEPVTGTWAHPLGTDGQGRDMLKLVVYGMRVSMEVGLIATMMAVLIGTVVGATAAHFGGYVDEVLMRYVDIQSTFPVFILLLLIIYAWGAGLWIIIVLLGGFGWEGISRLVRSAALQETEEPYVQAAKAAGASRTTIVRRHIIPNVSRESITLATLSVPGFILTEATLAFLGFSESVSWGRVVSDGLSDLSIAVWISFVPGLFLFFTVLSFNYVGEASQDVFDPRDTATE